MKRKGIFGKSVSGLIVAVLAVMAFIRGPQQLWFLLGAFAAWGAFLICISLMDSRSRTGCKSKNVRRAGKENPEHGSGECPNESLLLRHVNLRITSCLRSAYPGITWEWHSDSPERIITDGGTGRIRLFGNPDFNYADVLFGKFARIDCDMLRVVPLDGIGGSAENDTGAAAPEDGGSADPAVWYGLRGKAILENAVGDLNSRGYGNLTIKEDGCIHIGQAENGAIPEKFKNLPDRRHWPELVKMLQRDGLGASFSEDGIQVSW